MLREFVDLSDEVETQRFFGIGFVHHLETRQLLFRPEPPHERFAHLLLLPRVAQRFAEHAGLLAVDLQFVDRRGRPVCIQRHLDGLLELRRSQAVAKHALDAHAVVADHQRQRARLSGRGLKRRIKPRALSAPGELRPALVAESRLQQQHLAAGHERNELRGLPHFPWRSCCARRRPAGSCH